MNIDLDAMNGNRLAHWLCRDLANALIGVAITAVYRADLVKGYGIIYSMEDDDGVIYLAPDEFLSDLWKSNPDDIRTYYLLVANDLYDLADEY